MKYFTKSFLYYQQGHKSLMSENIILSPNRKTVYTVKILKFGTPQTIAVIVLKIEKFDVTLH